MTSINVDWNHVLLLQIYSSVEKIDDLCHESCLWRFSIHGSKRRFLSTVVNDGRSDQDCTENERNERRNDEDGDSLMVDHNNENADRQSQYSGKVIEMIFTYKVVLEY